MDYKVIFRDSFVADLETLLARIHTENPDAASRLGNSILRTAESLSSFPERFPRLRQRPGVRRFVMHRRFKVFYRIQREEKRGEVLRCWDGRRGTEPPLDSEQTSAA
jgi:plasmid stabilization system protein ParE